MATGVILYLLGGFLAVVSTLQLSHANPHDRLPKWGNPSNRPRSYLATWFGTLFCGILATTLSSEHIGPYAYLIFILVLLLPIVTLSTAHNRRVDRTRSG
jgi:hypothetical protein